MKYYISGKITGDRNYKKKFEAVRAEYAKKGHSVLSPHILPDGFSWDDYMQICMGMISVCDTVVLLPDWVDSKGARSERALATATGKKVEYMQTKELEAIIGGEPIE